MKDIYISRISSISGTDYREVHSIARALYGQLKSKTKRKPYIRSKYFNGEKVFLEMFWMHGRKVGMIE